METTYRSLMADELKRRQSINPSYSLRAMARDVGMTAPQLSSVLAGKKGMSPATAKKVANQLRLSDEEVEFFYQSATALHARNKSMRKEAKKSIKALSGLQAYQSLSASQFSVLNEWYYLSILQTFELRGFAPSTEWVSLKLGLTQDEVATALRELESAGLLKKKGSFYTPVKGFVKTDEIPSRKIRTHLQRMLKMASDALESQAFNERDFSSAVFPIDPARMDEFKRRLREFREDFCKFASKKGELSEVYNLSTQFFRVSKPSNDKEQL